MRVLIAEDDSLPRLRLKKTLEGWGYEVQAVENGVKAWETFQAERPSLIVSDWMMPQADGLDLCRRVRQDRTAYTYFILLTSRSDRESLIEALASGADDFIAKPFDDEELHARIRSGERILSLSRELGKRLEQLAEQNESIRKINTQMTHDMRTLLDALQRWSTTADPMTDPNRLLARREMREEVSGVIDAWVNSLQPLEPAKAAPRNLQSA